jgi:hypothetical protein
LSEVKYFSPVVIIATPSRLEIAATGKIRAHRVISSLVSPEAEVAPLAK